MMHVVNAIKGPFRWITASSHNAVDHGQDVEGQTLDVTPPPSPPSAQTVAYRQGRGRGRGRQGEAGRRIREAASSVLSASAAEDARRHSNGTAERIINTEPTQYEPDGNYEACAHQALAALRTQYLYTDETPQVSTETLAQTDELPDARAVVGVLVSDAMVCMAERR